jgi:hypothetical protein
LSPSSCIGENAIFAVVMKKKRELLKPNLISTDFYDLTTKISETLDIKHKSHRH